MADTMAFQPPMLAMSSTPSGDRPTHDYDTLMATGKWVSDLKLDGIRAYMVWDGATVTLLNRNGVNITVSWPELVDYSFGQEPLWLDGEIVCRNGSFEATLTRDKTVNRHAVAHLAQMSPAQFFAFDLPDLAAQPYAFRRHALETLADVWVDDRYAITLASENPGMLQMTRNAGMEGVILKRKAGRYRFGKRSADWIKCKNLHRISCLIGGIVPEKRAISVSVLTPDGTALHDLGTVGSGISDTQFADLRTRIARAEVLVAEVECLNLTSGQKLRFPVFKGLRSDVDPLTCTTDQLATIPNS